jgi:hypothetical protein
MSAWLLKGGDDMRGLFVFVINTFIAAGTAFAQNVPQKADPTDNPAANSAASKPSVPSLDQPQPQGPTGPTNTTSGGAPPSSPQGDTPSGMQPHPQDPKQDVGQKK